MTDIKIFESQEFGQVRTVDVDGEPWLVGKDVAEALGYENPARAIRSHVDEDDKGETEMVTPGGRQTAIIINESGLYSLVLSSKLPTAKKFKRWITSEVLPSIRKHGLYATAETVDKMLADPDTAIRLLGEIKAEREKRRQLEEQADRDRPKVLFAEAVATSSSSILVGALAKILRQNGVDIGQNRLFEWMRKNGYLIQRRGGDFNVPTQRAMEAGLFEIKETAITHADGHVTVNKTVKVTGKGQQYFIAKFLGGAS